jgi:hypothetical protein
MTEGINLAKIYGKHICKYHNVSSCTILYANKKIFKEKWEVTKKQNKTKQKNHNTGSLDSKCCHHCDQKVRNTDRLQTLKEIIQVMRP